MPSKRADRALVVLTLLLLAGCGGTTAGPDGGTPMAQPEGSGGHPPGNPGTAGTGPGGAGATLVGTGGTGMGGNHAASGGTMSGSGGASIAGSSGLSIGGFGGGGGAESAGFGGSGGAGIAGSGGSTRQCFPPPMTHNDARCPPDFIGYGHYGDQPTGACSFEGLACERWMDTSWNYCEQPPIAVSYICCDGRWERSSVGCADPVDGGSQDAATD